MGIEAAAVLIDPPPGDILPVVPNDPDDDHIVAAAVAARADVICTLNRHLHALGVRDYCAQRSIDILTDVELLERLRAEP